MVVVGGSIFGQLFKFWEGMGASHKSCCESGRKRRYLV